MKRRGLYGQLEGNERRNADASFADHCEDNRVVEGEQVAVLRRMAIEHNWKQIASYTAELKTKGFAQRRIDSMISTAMVGVKV